MLYKISQDVTSVLFLVCDVTISIIFCTIGISGILQISSSCIMRICENRKLRIKKIYILLLLDFLTAHRNWIWIVKNKKFYLKYCIKNKDNNNKGKKKLFQIYIYIYFIPNKFHFFKDSMIYISSELKFSK